MSLHLSRPGDAALRARLGEQSRLELSYPAPEATRDPGRLLSQPLPRGYRLHHARAKLGEGAACFEKAREALQGWAMFRVGWLEFCWPEAGATPGTTLGVLTHGLGLWSFHVGRVVYRDHETGPVESHALGWGTLPDHGLRGEERFAVEHHRGNDTVWYDLLAISRPRLPGRLAAPWLRRLQARFARDSLRAMQRAVGSGEDVGPAG